MELKQYYVVILRKGPTWTPDSTPELEALQAGHLAHLARMAEMGKMAVAGPVEIHEGADDIRGFSFFHSDAFTSVVELKVLVEQDPMIQVNHLKADYLTWFYPKESSL